jgi:hypothetical protein
MLKYISFSYLFLVAFVVQAQELKWIYKIGGTTAEYGTGVVVDRDQNIYDITNFMGTVSVAPMVTYTSKGEEDVLIRKSTSLGILQWFRQLSSKFQVLANDIAVDNQNNIYVTGTFQDSLYLGNDFLMDSPNLQTFSFLIKLNPSGNLLWARKYTSTLSVTARSLTVNNPEDLILSGNFEGNAFFGSGFPGFSSGANDVFVLKINGLTGNPTFIRRIGGVDHDYALNHAVDAQGNIYLTGDFRAEMDVDPSPTVVNVTPVGLTDIFLVKLSPSGNYVWNKTYGSIGVDYGQAVSVDIENNVILTGRFSENISFGSVSNARTSRGGTDIFLMKLNPSGNTIWVNTYGDMQNDFGMHVMTNKNGIIYFGGTFRGRVDFDPSNFSTNTDANGGSDIILALYNQDGTYNDHFTLGGIANEQLGGIALKSNGEMISTGGFGAIADFDPSSNQVNIFSNGGLDAFLWNTFVCVNPYLKTLRVEKSILCPGEKVLIQVEEGYLNDATQWSWQRNSCNSITFASGDFLNVDVKVNTTFFAKGFGGCVLNDQCKSVDIKVFKDSLIYQNIDLCQGDTLRVGNSRYTSNGAYVDTLSSVSGCDSVVFSEVTVLPSYRITQNVSICNGDTVKVGNFRYTLAGTYVSPLATKQGCDSIVTTILTVLPSLVESAEGIICKGDSILFNNIKYKDAGVYIQSSTGANGCKDLLVITIKVLETNFNRKVNICSGDSLRVGNSIYKTPGTYTDRLISTKGCDSIITTELSVLNTSSFVQELNLCRGDSIRIGKNVYKNAGFYTDTLVNKVGCDSILLTRIRLLNVPAPKLQNLTICEGDSLKVGAKYYKLAGTYKDTLQSANGCDSILTTVLSLYKKVHTIDRTICDGEQVKIGTQTFTKTGIFSILLKNIVGCDSVVQLVLTVNPTKSTNQKFKICSGESIKVGNNFYGKAGTYRDTLLTKLGCDSIITTTIEINNSIKNLKYDLCQGESVTINNKKYSLTGIFRDTIRKPDGCDSILIINLTVNPKYVINTVFEICKGGSVKVGNSTYFNAGKYTEFLVSSKGCDSLINFEVQIINFVPIFSVSRDTLKTFKVEGAQYQWYICQGTERIAIFGATKSEFAPMSSGRYSIGITFKGCTYFSDCMSVTLSSTNESSDQNIEIFPNPVVDYLQVLSIDIGQIRIMSVAGNILMTNDLVSGNQNIDVSRLPSGTYFAVIQTHNLIFRKTFIKI